ncbi:MAG: S8 family serine peptidase [Clostridia bacterium]|nr:S8 family serine peptidase [Clostridia bacterium]
MKRLIAIFSAMCMIVSCLSFCISAAGQKQLSLDCFIDELGESTECLEESGDDFEALLRLRVIVKAQKAPAVYASPNTTFSYDHVFVYQYDDENIASEALKYYKALPYVEWAEFDAGTSIQQNNYADAMLGTSDALAQIASYEVSTAPVKVAVVDTGIDFDYFLRFSQTRVTNSGCNTSDSGEADSAQDDHQHGSMVSEIIFKNTPNTVSITGYKALNSRGSGSDLAVATAIKKAADDGADIINLSLGGVKNDTMLDAVDYAYEKGCIVVCAAGNDSTDTAGIAPACSENVITVSSIDNSAHKSDFSNYGAAVDFAAPGSDIPFAYTGAKASGTSFSSPYIAALSAQVLSLKPSLTFEEVMSELSDVCVSADELGYQSGLLPCPQDQGQLDTPTSSLPKELFTIESSKKDYFGNGMPQIDTFVNRSLALSDTPEPAWITSPGDYTDTELYLAFEQSENTQIYYTTNETYPTQSATLYTEPIPIDKPTSVRAVAYTQGGRSFPISGRFIPYYHADEADFTLSQDAKTITAYTGTKSTIIVPESIGSHTPEAFQFYTPNTTLYGIILPQTIKSCTIEQNDTNPVGELNIFKAPGLEEITPKAHSFLHLSMAELPLVRSLDLQMNDYIKSISLPNAKEVNFNSCCNLEYANIPQCEAIEQNAFHNCKSLKTLYAPQAQTLGASAFENCYKLTEVTLDSVHNDESIPAAKAFRNTYCLKELHLPHLRYADTKFFEKSGVRDVYLPELESTTSLPDNEVMYTDDTPMPEKEHVRLYLTSAFRECSVSANRQRKAPLSLKIQYYHNLIDIYGTSDSFAQAYAEENQLDFYALPLLLSEPENMGYGAEAPLHAEVLGFHLSYQWYGTNARTNLTGEALFGETAATLNAQNYPYTYYYCRIRCADGAHNSDIYTGELNAAHVDLNADNLIDIADISLLLTHYAQAVSETNRYCDVNLDGSIDIGDIAVMTGERVYSKTY